MTHIMLDLETWGNRPGMDLRSIGACVFDPITGTVASRNSPGTFYVAVDNPALPHNEWWDKAPPAMSQPYYRKADGSVWHWDDVSSYRKYNLQRDPSTVKWWGDQSAEAQAAFNDPMDLMDGLTLFTEWYLTMGGTHIWGHGAHYDVPILAAAYHAVTGGYGEPWHYRAPRDTRTAFDMAGIQDHSAHLAAHNTGTHHHALDDALCQAAAVCDAWQRVQRWDDGK